MEIVRKNTLFTGLKMAGDDAGPGSGAGYGSVYGNADRDEEIMSPGVFADSLAGFLRDGFLGVGHDWKSGVGTISEAREETAGLFLSWEWHTDPEAQMYRKRVAERIARGKSVGLSVGFRVQESSLNEEVLDKYGRPQRTITKAELFEVSVVTVPANPLAQVMEAKGQRVLPATIREFEEHLREAGFSKSQAEAIASKGFGFMEPGPRGEPAPGDEGAIPAADDSQRIIALSAEIQRYLALEAQLSGVL